MLVSQSKSDFFHASIYGLFHPSVISDIKLFNFLTLKSSNKDINSLFLACID